MQSQYMHDSCESLRPIHTCGLCQAPPFSNTIKVLLGLSATHDLIVQLIPEYTAIVTPAPPSPPSPRHTQMIPS